MPINPKLIKKLYQNGGEVNPYDIPGMGTGGGQLFGDPGGWSETGHIDQPGAPGQWTPGFGGSGLITPGTGGEGTITDPEEETGGGPDVEEENWYQAEEWADYLIGQGMFLGEGFSQQDLENFLFDWMQGNIEGMEWDPNTPMGTAGGDLNEMTDWLTQQGILTTEPPEDPLTGGGIDIPEYSLLEPTPPQENLKPEGVGGNLFVDPETGVTTDFETGQQWFTDPSGNIQYISGAEDPSITTPNEFIGSSDLTPEMQQYLQSFMGEDWNLGTEGQVTVTNPNYTEGQNAYNLYLQEQELAGEEVLPFEDWYGTEESGFGYENDAGDWIPSNAPNPTQQIGSGTYEGVDWSDPASIEAALMAAGEGGEGFGTDVELGGIRGLDPEALAKMEDKFWDPTREMGRESMIAGLTPELQAKAGKSLNPELIKQQAKRQYQTQALALEENIGKKQAAAESDVMDIMGEWSDIFSAGG